MAINKDTAEGEVGGVHVVWKEQLLSAENCTPCCNEEKEHRVDYGEIFMIRYSIGFKIGSIRFHPIVGWLCNCCGEHIIGTLEGNSL